MFIKFIFAKLKNPTRPSGYASDYIQRLEDTKLDADYQI
jgi:hypothetical protein